MSETTFRTPSEPQSTAPSSPKDTTGTTSTEAPELVATYMDDQGKPYVAKYLNVESVYSEEPHLKNEVETIEKYIQDQVKNGKLDNSTKAADKFLKEMEKKAEISPFASANQRISKLLAYIDFRKVVDGTR